MLGSLRSNYDISINLSDSRDWLGTHITCNHNAYYSITKFFSSSSSSRIKTLALSKGVYAYAFYGFHHFNF
ncbi:hypothetical protein L1887_13652 [Cichorium endivia]|nr:hypothetical protein L1887_13652 [Cichorium endivia]